MTAEAQTPPRPPASAEPSLGVNWGVLSMWAIGLLVILVVGMAFGLVSLNSKLDDLQKQVAGVGIDAGAASTFDVSSNVDDACRLLGALAFKAGVDIPTAFADEGSTGTCETAAEDAFHRAKTR
jgi:hypothetical protein